MKPIKQNPQETQKSSVKSKPQYVADRSRPAVKHTAGTEKKPQPSMSKMPVGKQTSAWTQILFDDFNVNNLLDPLCPWKTGYDWGQTLGSELEYYTRYDKNFTTACAKGGQNHTYQGSSIKLVAKHEPAAYEVWRWDSNFSPPLFYTTCDFFFFTSGLLVSKEKYLYGQFEIRCKIPFDGQKLWPAFWLYYGGGPTYREIDIFEFEDPNTAKRMLMNVHIAQALDFGRAHQEPPRPDPVNDYGDEVILSSLDLANTFHTYAVQWFPNSITWLVDGVPVRTLAGHSPPLDMNLIINLAIAPWRPAPNPADLPASFEIDYVKIYKSTRPEFQWRWDNGGANKIAVWNMKPDDKFVAGDFDGDGKTQLLAFSSNSWSHLMKWDGTNWQYQWGNNGDNQIAVWSMKPTDRFVVGDFDGDGKSELLAFSVNGWSHLMKWDGTNWQYVWGNQGANQIAVWNMKPDDKFVAGDFDGDGKSELLVFSTNNWSHLMKWDGANWQYVWGNNGDNKIAVWQMKANDRFVVGDFDGDGKNELLAFSMNGWSHLMKWDGVNWQYIWGNQGANQIAVWNMKPDDRFVVADFDGDGKSELLAFSTNGWCHMMKWDGTGWQYLWGNDGGETIYPWFMKTSDKYLGGRFEGTKAQLFAASVNGWVHLLKFEPLP
jgi:beta-glucanase (GH16 family)